MWAWSIVIGMRLGSLYRGLNLPQNTQIDTCISFATALDMYLKP